MISDNRLVRLIYSGTLVKQLTELTPEVHNLFYVTRPFAADRPLLAELNALTADVVPYRLERLRNYFNKLQTTCEYEAFQHYCDNIGTDENRNAHQQQPLADYAQLHTDTPLLQARLRQLESEHDYVALHQIRGDGNCYFRAVMRNYLEQAIIAVHPNRQRLLNHLAGLIRAELLDNVNSCFRTDFPMDTPAFQRMTALANTLVQAANGYDWPNLQTFRQALINATEDGADYQLIIAARYLVAACVMENRNTVFNDLTLQNAILFTTFHPTLEEYRDAIITLMGVCAEGPWVDLHFLPKMLGAHGRMFIVSRAANEHLQELNGGENTFYERYQLQDIPQLTVSLAFFPGHYDALISRDYYQAQQANLAITAYPSYKTKCQTIITSLNRLTTRLQNQIAELSANGDQTAVNAVQLLLQELDLAQAQYFQPNDSSHFDAAAFQRAGMAAIERAKPILSVYQGIEQLLLDILNVLLFPIGLIKLAITGKFRLFELESKQIPLLNNLNSALHRVEAYQ
jgi:hypothetical protein